MLYSFEEYKILQDKTDKIGAFRFTIKGWSITAVVGGLVAVSADKGAPPSIVASILCVCLFWLFIFERQQVKLSRRIGIRALEIEDEIDRVRKHNKWKNQFSSPQLANILTGRNDPKLRKNRAKARRVGRLAREIRLSWKSDALFYLMLIALSWAPVLHQSANHETPPSTVVSGDKTLPQAPTTPVQAGKTSGAADRAGELQPNSPARKGTGPK